jgi:hypothetical protein
MPVLPAFAGGPTPCISAFAALCFAQTPTAPKDTKDKQETCPVSGMVVRVADGIPLKGATLRLENGIAKEEPKTKTTNTP